MEELQIQVLVKVMTYLAQRDHSDLELQQKLIRKFPQELCRWAIEEARAKGWLRPPEVLANSTAKMLHNKRKGILYIQNYLKSKGLPCVSVDYDLEESKCREWYQLKFTQIDNSAYEDQQKAIRFLRNRGFLDETIKKVIYEN